MKNKTSQEHYEKYENMAKIGVNPEFEEASQ